MTILWSYPANKLPYPDILMLYFYIEKPNPDIIMPYPDIIKPYPDILM